MTKINWKSDAVNLTKQHPRVLEDGDISEPGSFFNFFEGKDDPFDVSSDLFNQPTILVWLIMFLDVHLDTVTSAPTRPRPAKKIARPSRHGFL